MSAPKGRGKVFTRREFMAFPPTMRRTVLTMVSLATALTVIISPAEGALERPTSATPQADARIGIAGYGGHTIGGRGGRTIRVTNRNDSGPGSLRAAVEAKGRRIVRFGVAGTITLRSDLKIKHPYITIAGNLAPGQGIQVRGHSVLIVTHDVILRHLRLRPGDAFLTSGEADEADGLTINGVGKNVYNVVLDHMSLLWGPDIGGLAILGNVHDLTVQNSIIGEGLFHSRMSASHDREGHSMGANIVAMDARQTPPQRITFFRNLFTTSDSRMPRLQGARCIDLVNNVIYNWGRHAATGNPDSANLVGNWFRRGPRIGTHDWWLPQHSSAEPHLYHNSVFTRDNRTDGFTGRRRANPVVYAATSRCGGLSVHASPVGGVLNKVLTNVGPRLPAIDSVDRRIKSNVRNRLGRFFNGVGYSAPHPYWPTLSATLP
jgi:pectate lyase